MRLNNYLLEYGESRSKVLNAKDFLELLLEKCSRSMKGTAIYRRYFEGASMYYVDSHLLKRTSQHTYNYYTLLMDYILPSWKGWPKREYGIICATGKNDHLLHGESYRSMYYRVFPYDNAKIAVCPQEDIWYSFKDLEDLNNFNEALLRMSITFLGGQELEEDNPEKLKVQLINLGKKIYERSQEEGGLAFSDRYRQFIADMAVSHKGDLLKALNRVMDPKDNGFKMVKPGSRFKTGGELWIEGEALMIQKDEYLRAVKKGLISL